MDIVASRMLTYSLLKVIDMTLFTMCVVTHTHRHIISKATVCVWLHVYEHLISKFLISNVCVHVTTHIANSISVNFNQEYINYYTFLTLYTYN